MVKVYETEAELINKDCQKFQESVHSNIIRIQGMIILNITDVSIISIILPHSCSHISHCSRLSSSAQFLSNLGLSDKSSNTIDSCFAVWDLGRMLSAILSS